MIQYFARPENGAEGVIGPTLGPFKEFLQLTYGELRIGPDGDVIGGYSDKGYWVFDPTLRSGQKEYRMPIHEAAQGLADGKKWFDQEYTDVVIFANEVPDPQDVHPWELDPETKGVELIINIEDVRKNIQFELDDITWFLETVHSLELTNDPTSLVNIAFNAARTLEETKKAAQVAFEHGAIAGKESVEDSPSLIHELNNGGTLEFSPDENKIRYRDVDGNCEAVYEEGDEEFNHYRSLFTN